MKLKYNAPVTLTFSLICGVVLLLGTIIPGLRDGLFVAAGQGGFSFANPLSYLRLFSHIFGHADIGHLLSNLTFILLLGPILESLYGARNLIFMMLITAVATAVLNLILFPSGLLGASGIVFMMILLSSFTNFAKGEIPITFILVVVLFLGKEVIHALQANDISEFAHIIGGLFGSIFGFLQPTGTKGKAKLTGRQTAELN
ncbi:MAG: rhomboid family intramembrane serine protease [Spirochaetes bacterium GWD1_61_31]|nr:MAG: rhomboid family intramembrane serine protease [Spirochaetes bacterium GWB1_60_80]OHD30455.1 MAG: rhomboid family intramembrane serine protease [Spirochaetes bacterium GWC1_61_12]OHD41295.1 MAG: rhomboid family intramembrane serine protease [Spirochaetes bacterium GWD1_61_31]OHD44407.1 MAG: rhomboid family intramembrane serine protease [Spirochaetes bacterium GWE1_60_18]OHD60859.1 MAG: rhomboid family intramembrane serine protease [Spirochaetes bacterium GWF1_60_12]HAP43821.1 rhomboid f